MKKFVSAALAGSMLLSLCSCASKGMSEGDFGIEESTLSESEESQLLVSEESIPVQNDTAVYESIDAETSQMVSESFAPSGKISIDLSKMSSDEIANDVLNILTVATNEPAADYAGRFESAPEVYFNYGTWEFVWTQTPSHWNTYDSIKITGTNEDDKIVLSETSKVSVTLFIEDPDKADEVYEKVKSVLISANKPEGYPGDELAIIPEYSTGVFTYDQAGGAIELHFECSARLD
jgi:hypothetical protein